jgi:hypothetical protein
MRLLLQEFESQTGRKDPAGHGLLKPVEVREQCLAQPDGVAARVAHQLMDVLEDVAAAATEVPSQVRKRLLGCLQRGVQTVE